MCVPPFTCFCFGKGCCHSRSRKKGLLYKQHPKNYSRTLCSPCHKRIQGRPFTALDVRSFITSPGLWRSHWSSIQSIQAFWHWHWNSQNRGTIFHSQICNESLLFSCLFQQGGLLGQCKIVCHVFAFGLWAWSFCVLSWKITSPGHSTFADVKNQVFSWDMLIILTPYLLTKYILPV